MRGVLLLLLTFFAVCSVPEAQNVYDNEFGNRNDEYVPSEENEENFPPNVDDGNIDNEDTFPPSTSLPNADEIEDEVTTDVSDGNYSFNSDSSTFASLLSTEDDEVGTVHKPRRTQPQKEPGSCGPPPFFERATIASGKNSTYGPGSVVTYSCQFGYVSDGLRQVKCSQSEESGELEWSQSEVRCTPRSCGDPGSVDNGMRIGSLFTFPNRVSFECDEGYELKGNNARYCQPSGTWSGKLPKCQKLSCKPPPDIENGKVSYSSLEFGSQLRYTCDPGFILRNHYTRYCAGNRTWSGEDPVCKDAQCDLPVAPKDGSFQLIGEKPVVDTRVIFECDGNKILSGNRVSICMENGDWTFPPPSCIDPCSIPRVLHGKIGKYAYRWYSEVPVGSVVDSRDKLYLSCDRNYEPLGKPEKEVRVKCTNGVWENFPTCEPASCNGDYPRTRNGYKTRMDRKNGGYVYYGCNTHFYKAQTGNITCSSGSWTGITPVCSDTRCYFSKLPLNGLKETKETFYDHEFFNPVCERKYTLTKLDNRLKCSKGEWIGHLPPCMPASCKDQPPLTAHGRFKSYSENHSSVVEYECEDGFVLDDQKSSKVECLFGEWKGTPPKCKDSRCYHKDLPKSSGLEINDGFTPDGEYYMNVKCIEGYTLEKNSEPYCSKGVWEQPISPCRENSCTSSKIQNGDFHQKIVRTHWIAPNTVDFEKVALNEVYKPGDKLFVICESPFTFQGKGGNTVEVKCLGGQWHPAPVCFITGTIVTSSPKPEEISTAAGVTSRPNVAIPTAAKRVGPVPDEVCSCTYLNYDYKLVGLAENNEPLTSGTRVKKNCRIKFYCRQFGVQILSGTPELVCDRCEDWHSSKYPDCVNPNPQEDVVLSFSHKFNITHVDEITLQEGQSLQVYCFSFANQYVEWEYPSHTPGITLWRDNIHLGNGINRPVYILEILASVHNSGVYSCYFNKNRPRVIRIKVKGIECPLIEETEVLSVNYEDGQKTNSRVFFSCKEEGARLEGYQVLTCQSNGRWSGEIPLCYQPVQCPELEAKEGITVDYINGRYVGSTAVFHCFAPRKRIGEGRASCREDGTWSHPVPLCSLPNCSLDALFRSFPEDVTTDNELRKSDAMPYNSTVTLRCKDENHVLVGRSEVTCTENGTWTVPNLKCMSGCAPPQPPDAYLIVEPSQNSYDIGDRIVLSCPAGMQLSSDVVRLMCLHEGWSETQLPSCKN